MVNNRHELNAANRSCQPDRANPELDPMTSSFPTRRLATLTASLLLASASFAIAADYDPPIFIEEAPEFVPVEIGSGWYIRGDISYNFKRPFRDFGFAVVPPGSYSEYHSMFGGGVGFGYHFTDFLRADFNAAFLSKNSFAANFDDGTNRAAATGETRIWSGMANLYVDLGTVAGITPYVGAGVGTVYTSRRLSAQANGPAFGPDPVALDDRKNAFTLAYSLNAGVAYKLTNNASVDIGYQYLKAPKAEYVAAQDFTTYPVRRGMDFHQLRVGFRYDLW